MNIVKRIITFRPGSTTRLITSIVALLAILTVCGITGVADVMRDLAFRDAVYKGRLIEEGARAYMDQCARCHGREGKGSAGQGPALSSKNFFDNRIQEIGWTGSLEAYLTAVTRSGIPLKSSNTWEVIHPPFSDKYGGPLRDDQIDNITRFILNWKQSPTDGADIVNAPKPGEGMVPKPTAVPLTPEQEEGKAIFLKNGCNACHTIKGVANSQVGPTLTVLYAEAIKWIASPEYKASPGKATTPEDYIRESILHPAFFLVPQCPQSACLANVMPPTYPQTISAADLDKLVAYLASLGTPAQ